MTGDGSPPRFDASPTCVCSGACRPVLRVAEGDPIPSVARALRVSGRSLQRWVQVYRRRRRPEDLLDARRSGRPRTAGQLDQAAWAQAPAQDPRALGYRATTWTTPLLATHLRQACGCSISARPLRRRLQEGGQRGKRPRYVFSERDAAVGQKKGASAACGKSSPAMCSCLPTGLCCGCFLPYAPLGGVWVNRPACP